MSASLSAQLITISIISLQRQILHNNNVNRTSIDANYDYIVVGSGSAGAVVANRLAANSNLRVLLLEAGGPQNVVSDMPGLAQTLMGSDVDWQYTTVPQTNLGQAYNGNIRTPRGKIIGGTSSINLMFYNRGNRRSYDNWANTFGATGWDYNSVLPYFIRSENNTSPQIVAQNPGYHGTMGLMGVSPMPHSDPILYLFQEQMNSFGIPTLDINGANQVGTMIYELTVKDGVRSGTGNAYIDPNPYPNNLDILINAHVTSILFSNDSVSHISATGVQYRRNGNTTYTAQANREVIISAGCIGSPQLLLLSGIGPREHLESLGIPVLADLPVGNNYQDHVLLPHYYEVRNESLLNEPIGPTVQQLYEFYVGHTGVLTQFPSSITFFSTQGNDDPQWPNTVIDAATSIVSDNLTQSTAEYVSHHTEWQDFWSSYLGRQYMSFATALYRSYSRGTVRLASTDPMMQPLIDPRYLSDLRDMEALVNMTKILFYTTQTGKFTRYAQIFSRPIPGCTFCADRPMYHCDSYVRCIIRQLAQSAWHPGGTCRMGAVNRTDVVVDPQLRVKGVSRLRVIDSSIFPELPNANTNAASVMAAERGVQFIIDGLNG